MKGPIVLALQFWSGDKAKAMRLAKLIADIQPASTHSYHFLFVPRFDCDVDRETMEYVAKKFPVTVHKTKRKEIGWPAGPNGMASDLFMESLQRWRTRAWSNVEAVWLLEADAMPLKANWLDLIRAEWETAGKEGKIVLGAWQKEWSPVGHVNGNLLFAPNLASRVRGLEGCPPHIPWDTYHAVALSRHWKKSSLMVNFYKRTEVKPEELQPQWCFVHGVKDDSLYDFIRATLVAKEAYPK